MWSGIYRLIALIVTIESCPLTEVQYDCHVAMAMHFQPLQLCPHLMLDKREMDLDIV